MNPLTRADPTEHRSEHNPSAHFPRGTTHFPERPHKGDDPDYNDWAELDLPRAWQRLGDGERLPATDGERRDLIATSKCTTCVEHGPW